MLNKVLQMKLMRIIKNIPVSELQNHTFEDEKENKQFCLDMLEFITNELYSKLSQKRKNASDILSRLIFVNRNVFEIYLNHCNNDKILISKNLNNQLHQLLDLYNQNMTKKSQFDLDNLDYIDNELKSNEESIQLKEEKETVKINKDDLPDPQKLQSELTKIKEKLVKNKKNLKEAKEEVKELKQQLKEKVDTSLIETYENKINQLLQDIDNLKIKEEKLHDLLKYSNMQTKYLGEKLKTITEKFNQMDSEYQVLKKAKDDLVNQEKFNNWLDSEILKYIIEKNHTITELKDTLSYKSSTLTAEDIFNSLNRLKSRYSIIQYNMRHYDIGYAVGYKNSNTFSIDEIHNQTDLILIADLHISNNIDLETYNLNLIYEYAVKHNIRTIINLGDLMYSEIYTRHLDMDNFKLREEFINQIIEKLPKDKNIINLLLGGNHDKNILHSGIDIVKKIADNRMDYVNLGYDHSILNIGDTIIGLHHGNKKYSGVIIDNTSFNDKSLIEGLDKFYQMKNLSRSNTYIDLLGHFHISKLSTINSYAMIPSLNYDHITNGAWRIKLEFSNNKLTNMVLIPLIINDNRIIETSSINYQKIK